MTVGQSSQSLSNSFADAIRRSGLLAPEVATLLPGETDQIAAKRLVEQGHLTAFQAEKLLAGHWHGLRLGEYHILKPIGRGGAGMVYLARATAASTLAKPLVALKILPPRKAREEPRTRLRFAREIEMTRRLPRHENLVRMIDGGEFGSVMYLALEYIHGVTLKSLVVQNGPLKPSLAARIGILLAEVLRVIHEQGLVHRDLKPANVMIQPHGTPILLDFGFALELDQPTPTDPTLFGGPGYALGTMDYIAPEQAKDASSVTPAADYYALGGTLYFMLAGCPPFPGGSLTQKIRWHQSEEPPSLLTLVPTLPPELVAVVAKLLQKQPAARFPDADQIIAALQPFAELPESPADSTVSIPIQSVVENTLALPISPLADEESWVESSIIFLDNFVGWSLQQIVVALSLMASVAFLIGFIVRALVN